MLDGLFRSTFRTKCKSLLSRTKTRLEVIKKRRNAMQKFLKKDVAELLKSNLETNAYGRAEGLYMELNLSSCYEYIEQCCTYIAENLKEMHKQSECPEQCRVVVSSLNYAAARFADLPELRDLRNLFNDKYGNALEPFSNKEFIERLKYKPPTTQMKLQLMQEIAQEYSVTWDPTNLEKQLQCPSLSTQEKTSNLFRNRSTLTHGKGKQVDNGTQIDEEETLAAKNRRRNSISVVRQNVNAENNANRKPFASKIVPSPYTTTSNDNDISQEGGNQKNEDEDSVVKVNSKPRPRSVRTKFSMSSMSTSSTSTSSTSSEYINDPRESVSARIPQARGRSLLSDDEDEEEEKVDKLLTLFGKKKPTESLTPTSARKDDYGTPKGELPPPPGRRRYLFSENQPETPMKDDSEKSKFCPPGQKQYPLRQVKSTPHLSEEAAEHHVHPKMPDFDELAERIAVLKHI